MGSGKSSVLSAVMADMKKKRGQVERARGLVACITIATCMYCTVGVCC